jgi:hypothetical protein
VTAVVKAAKFIESDGLAGKLSVSSVFPQYLMNAMFGWAIAVALPIRFDHLRQTWQHHNTFYTNRQVSLITFP